jgi:hypothetical protein
MGASELHPPGVPGLSANTEEVSFVGLARLLHRFSGRLEQASGPEDRPGSQVG